MLLFMILYYMMYAFNESWVLVSAYTKNQYSE